MKKVAVLVAFLLLILIGTTGAADLKALLDQAAKQADAGQIPQAAVTLRKALAHIWSLNPISIKGATLVSEKASGYGQYTPRPDNVFKAGEPIYIYTEPAGYRFKHQGDTYSFGFSVDFNVLDEKGEVLGGQRDFGQWTFSSRQPMFEVFVNLTYNLTGAPAGKYIFETIFKDHNGGGQVSFKIPIEIR